MGNVKGLEWSDLQHMPATMDMGWNATGVIRTSLHIEGNEIITRESMPGHFVQDIMDSVHELSRQSVKKHGGRLAGQIPLPIWKQWRSEWEAGPKRWGVPWRKHFQTAFLNSDYNKFRVRT